MTDYKTLNAQLSALVKGVPHPVANLANAAALLYHTLDGLNWAGFYLLEGDTLVLGPFQGRPACIEIPVGRGVCGAAASRMAARSTPSMIHRRLRLLAVCSLVILPATPQPLRHPVCAGKNAL